MKKTIILLLIFLLTIGIVTATNIDDIKMPDNFESVGEGLYTQNDPWTHFATGFYAAIYDYSNSSFQVYINNSTHRTVNKTGDLYRFVDGNNEGVIEVIEIDGSRYMVIFHATEEGKGGIDQAYKYMMEFNRLNGVKPLAV